MKKTTGNMKRIILFFFSALCITTCSAQLSKFEGTWTHKNIVYYGEQVLPLYKIFKISVDKEQVYIRLKDTNKDLDGNERVSYYKIRDIRIDGDSLISCNVFFPPDVYSRYSDSAKNPYTPNRHLQFDLYEEYEVYEMSIRGGVLIVNVPYLVQKFYMNNTVVDRNMISRNYNYECYNEKDNW